MSETSETKDETQTTAILKPQSSPGARRIPYDEVIDAEFTDKILNSVCEDCARTLPFSACTGGEKCPLDIISRLQLH